MNPARVASIWTYPVKSMVGGTVDTAELSSLGIVGDRHWAVRSLEWGGVRGAKKIGSLMQCAARELNPGRPADGVEITLPDGSTVRSGDADKNERLSAALGHRVEFVQLPADGDDTHFRRGPATGTDPMGELRAVFGRD
ncbi:MAG: MOSC N-terminal beta barrel domain-containing protein, partial [Acidimicrobiales bacterium]